MKFSKRRSRAAVCWAGDAAPARCTHDSVTRSAEARQNAHHTEQRFSCVCKGCRQLRGRSTGVWWGQHTLGLLERQGFRGGCWASLCHMLCRRCSRCRAGAWATRRTCKGDWRLRVHAGVALRWSSGGRLLHWASAVQRWG